MLVCPKCDTERVHASRRGGAIEKIVLAAIFVRPFRCESCDFRFFRWSLSANPNSPISVGARFYRWLHYEDDVDSVNRNKV